MVTAYDLSAYRNVLLLRPLTFTGSTIPLGNTGANSGIEISLTLAFGVRLMLKSNTAVKSSITAPSQRSVKS